MKFGRKRASLLISDSERQRAFVAAKRACPKTLSEVFRIILEKAERVDAPEIFYEHDAEIKRLKLILHKNDIDY